MKKIALLILTAFCFTVAPVLAGSVNLMEITELKPMLGSDEVVILDVRSGRDWSTSQFKIPEAVRASGEEFDTWGNTYPKDQKLVLYCA